MEREPRSYGTPLRENSRRLVLVHHAHAFANADVVPKLVAYLAPVVPHRTLETQKETPTTIRRSRRRA